MTKSVVSNMRQEVLQVFQETTRYPAEILDPQANIEEDLGIDSVKLGEVFSVLRERYRLPEKLDLPAESFRTIGGIAEALGNYMDNLDRSHQDGHPVAVPHAAFESGHRPSENGHRLSENGRRPSEIAAPRSSAGEFNRQTVAQIVMDTFKQITRYPEEVLDPRANLEEDLGIDSVKLGEVFSVLREEFHLSENLVIPIEHLSTIDGISGALYSYLNEARQKPVEDYTMRHGHSGNGASNGHLMRTPEAAPVPKPAVSKLLQGKIAFVSGSGRGLGRDIACHLAQLGATVIINSFHSRERGDQTEEEIRREGGEVHHLWGSMANPEQVHRMFDQIEARYGGLDFFISNASNGMLARLEDLTVEHWEKAFRTNVVGLHQGALRAARLMKRRGGGKIVTLSSPAAHGYVDYFGCMGAVKAAVECLTRSMAIEFAPDNIQVNCVSPGPIDGELLRKWPDSERLVRQWKDATPMGRLCEHREVSHFVAYLLSDPVKAFTGSVLVMDGGISAQGW